MATKSNENMEAATTTVAAPFSLPNKIVRIRPVMRKHALSIYGKDQEIVKSNQIMLTGVSKSLILPVDSRNGRLINPFRSTEERIFLEQRIGYNLDINKNDDDNFLAKCRITVSKQTDDIDAAYHELDLSNPYDYILYLIALVCPEVSKYKTDYYSGEILFYIDDEIVAEKNTKEINDTEEYCLQFLFAIKGKKKQLYNFIRTYHVINKLRKSIDPQASEDWLYNEIRELIRDKKTRPYVHSLCVMATKDIAAYQLKLVIQDAMDIGEIGYVGDGFKLVSSGQLLGSTFADVEFYLKNPINQAVKARILQQIELAKGKL